VTSDLCQKSFTFNFSPPRLQIDNKLYLVSISVKFPPENVSLASLHLHDHTSGEILNLDFPPEILPANGIFDITAEVYPFWVPNLKIFQLEFTLSYEKHYHITPKYNVSLEIQIEESPGKNVSTPKRGGAKRMAPKKPILAPNCEEMWGDEFLGEMKVESYDILGASCCKRNLDLDFRYINLFT